MFFFFFFFFFIYADISQYGRRQPIIRHLQGHLNFSIIFQTMEDISPLLDILEHTLNSPGTVNLGVGRPMK